MNNSYESSPERVRNNFGTLQYQEKIELNKYEFFLLSKTNNLLSAKIINSDEIDKFYKEFQYDLRAQKLGSFNTIVGALLKEKNKENNSTEKAEIKERLNRLKKGGLLSRIRSKL